jgi:hypothetical protein
MPTRKTPSAGKKVRRIARNVIGIVPPEKVIVPKNLRKKPKHKKPPNTEE